MFNRDSWGSFLHLTLTTGKERPGLHAWRGVKGLGGVAGFCIQGTPGTHGERGGMGRLQCLELAQSLCGLDSHCLKDKCQMFL